MSGRPTAAQVAAWAGELDTVADRIGRHFARSEPRRRAAGYIRGLLSETERKNGWQLAEHLGDPTPDGSGTCWPGPTGTPTPYATTWRLTPRNTSATRAGCWWRTRPGSSRRARS